MSSKNPGVAALCSFIFPGLGQIYNGDIKKGILIPIGVVIGLFFLMIPSFIVWVYGIYNAYTTTKKMNDGEIPYIETNAMHMFIFVIGWFILAFIILMISAFIATFVFGITS
ncbi:DUF5683 domain-containing protein [Methanocalculus sp.]|uniref:DUF5683 domain-containing protein n=1 Tax=Methanocalculus sp. TaxID=2004547 RepID=UPI0026169DF3|nr:DUF5683 domain-containing protein [Methanocalculus sp.]MDG6250361.1 DUF5683 domain-containing protein [Methanocalculus sp.]